MFGILCLQRNLTRFLQGEKGAACGQGRGEKMVTFPICPGILLTRGLGSGSCNLAQPQTQMTSTLYFPFLRSHVLSRCQKVTLLTPGPLGKGGDSNHQARVEHWSWGPVESRKAAKPQSGAPRTSGRVLSQCRRGASWRTWTSPWESNFGTGRSNFEPRKSLRPTF